MTGGEIPDSFLPRTARLRRCTQYCLLQRETVTAQPEKKKSERKVISFPFFPADHKAIQRRLFKKDLASAREVTTVNAHRVYARIASAARKIADLHLLEMGSLRRGHKWTPTVFSGCLLDVAGREGGGGDENDIKKM